jgi:hypothetical protein
MSARRLLPLLVLVALLFGVAACFPEPDVGEPFAGLCEPEDSDPSASVSFGLEVRPLFDRSGSEGGCSCHNAGASAPAGFDMSTLVNSGRNVIVPGDPCASMLVHKISAAPPSGARMPLAGPPFLTDEEQQLVHDWIAEGALDN